MNILQSIFTDYYEHIIYELHPRPAVIENVDKMIHCGDPSYGGTMYGCSHCGNLKFVPFRCSSRFCPTCGNKYNQLRSFHMSCKLVSCVHRHCVFTIPEGLRIFFLQDRRLLSLLFSSVRDVVLRMFAKINKAENFTPGLICVLHTFDRDLKWNPHIHALISEVGAGNISPWRVVKHFDYTFLRNAFRKVLLERMTSAIGPSFRKIKNDIYKNHSEGFYVRAKPNPCTPDMTIKYISRYLGRPVIAASRIDKYDGEFVTFHYTRHEDNKTIEECVPALDFIKRLIIHIPENISRCCVTMVSMPSTISRRRSSADVFLLKSGNFYQVYRIGVLPFFFLSGITLYAVLIVVPPCRFWKFTTKKLHCLNDIERLWDMVSSILAT